MCLKIYTHTELLWLISFLNHHYYCVLVAADYKYELDAKKKAERKDPLYNEALPFYFNKFDAIVKENNGHVANKKVSVSCKPVDLILVNVTRLHGGSV